eukprot:749795-Hanusia_phi.AAC.3
MPAASSSASPAISPFQRGSTARRAYISGLKAEVEHLCLPGSLGKTKLNRWDQGWSATGKTSKRLHAHGIFLTTSTSAKNE